MAKREKNFNRNLTEITFELFVTLSLILVAIILNRTIGNVFTSEIWLGIAVVLLIAAVWIKYQLRHRDYLLR